jgi:hypothetical protein
MTPSVSMSIDRRRRATRPGILVAFDACDAAAATARKSRLQAALTRVGYSASE